MIRRGLRGPRAAAVLVTALVCAAPALAQTSLADSTGDTRAPPAFGTPLDPEGGNLFGVFFGYGFNQSIYSSAQGIDIASTGVRWSHLWAVRGSGVFRGQRGLGIEFVPVTNFVDAKQSTWGFGANLLYEYHFATPGRVLPIWRIGAGLVYATRPVPRDGTRRNFSVMTDLGADIALTDRSAAYLGYRFHHVSNAATGPSNPGINVHSVVFGLSLYR